MRACTFISKRAALAAAALAFFGAFASAHAAEGEPAGPVKTPAATTLVPEDEDFSGNAYTEYGDFNSKKEEEDDSRFWQYGRFFGVSIAGGAETALGNRGQIWSGGFPAIDLKVHYWFDFNLALDLGYYMATQNYNQGGTGGRGPVTVNLAWFGIDVKYYFDTSNMSAPISFANPYLLVGFGSYTKTEVYESLSGQTTSFSNGALCVGAGLEFALQPKKIYFTIESKLHLISFDDDADGSFSNSNGLANISGPVASLVAGFLFTW